ncbi:MAG: tetratricopeptide repeat protein [Ekhidna sp.]
MEKRKHTHKLLLYIVLFTFLLSVGTSSSAQSFFQKAENSFAKRYKNFDGTYANKFYVNKAVRDYKKSEKTPETIAALLRAYEFKASYTKQSKIIKKKIYKKAVDLGKKGMRQYPENIAIKYYYMANLGRWGQEVSIVKATRKGVVDEIRTINTELIEIDSTFDEAGALRILGAMHLKIPRVPFIIDWPSEEKALLLLRSAYRQAPLNVGNVLLYAEALIKIGEEEEAKPLLEDIMTRKPRKSHLLEEQKKIEEATRLYNKTYS